MSFAKVIGAVVLVVFAGLGAFGVDYATQRVRAGTDLGGQAYVRTLLKRIGDKAGMVGLSFRTSSVASLPPAPAGWTAETWCADHDDFLFSPAQTRAHDRQVQRATAGLPVMAKLSPGDTALRDAFLAEASIVYRTDRGMIRLDIDDPERQIPLPDLTAFEWAVEAHFERLDHRREHATYQGVSWVELRGPVETADNGPHPHRLRRFVARLGEIDLRITTRAPDHQIERFFQTFDLDGFRRPPTPPQGEWPRALPAKLAMVTAGGSHPVPKPVQIRVNRGLD